MAQVNITKSLSFQIPPDGMLGYGFDSESNPCIVNLDGSKTIIPLTDEAGGVSANILANKGIGIEANLPTVYVGGDTYVTDDTFKVFVAQDSFTWNTTPLSISQLITDTSATDAVAYQYDGVELISLGGSGGDSVLSMSTGVIYGGELSINGVDAATFDLAAGKGVFIDVYTDPTAPVYTIIEWADTTGVTVTNIATQIVTFVKINDTGTLVQSATTNSLEEHREIIELGVIVHTNLTDISDISNLIQWNQDVALSVTDLAESISTINIYGNIYSGSGSNTYINKSLGLSFAKGANYLINKKIPNTISSPAENELTYYKATSDTFIGTAVDIDTVFYQPGGVGGLVPLPSGSVTTHGVFFSPTTGITVIQYGQYLYDSLKEAVDSWEKESYIVSETLRGVRLAGVIAFVAGATDLSNPYEALFITPGAFGMRNIITVPNYSAFASYDKSISGMSYKRPDVSLVLDGGIVYAEVERLGGGDFICVFGEREYLLDCITGPGTDGKARVALVSGSASTTQKNYVYITPAGTNGDALLLSSTNRPTGEFSYVLDCSLKDSTFFTSYGAVQARRCTDAKEFDGRSSIARTNEWIRLRPAEYEDGAIATLSLTATATEDPIEYSVTAGTIWQKHLQDFPALSIDTNFIYIANHPTTPFLPITDLRDPEALQTSDGISLVSARFNWVFSGIINKSTGECKLLLTLPNGSYGTDQNAVDDPNRTAVTSFEKNLKGTVFLLDRLAVRHRTTGTGTYQNLHDLIQSKPTQDLRGELASTTGGSGSPAIGTSFEDLVFNIYNALNGFNFRFDASLLSANRIITIPDVAGTVAILEAVKNQFTGQAHSGFSVSTFSATKTFDCDLGSNHKMPVTADTTINITKQVPGVYVIKLPIVGIGTPIITIGASLGLPMDNNAPLLAADGDTNTITIIVDAEGVIEYTINTKTA